MYCLKSRIRYSETDEKGQLKLESFVDYFQDCSTFQSEDLGVGVQWLLSRNRCWVLNSWQIRIHRYPKLGDAVEVYTWPYSLKGILGDRNYMLKDDKGEVLAEATSLWSYFDTQNKRPAKIDEDVLERYTLEPGMDAMWEGRKILMPKQMQALSSFCVQRNHLDTNHHVNNSAYVKMALEYLPADYVPDKLRVEYKRSAVYGDVIFPHINIEESRIVVALSDENEMPYAIVEFKC